LYLIFSNFLFVVSGPIYTVTNTYEPNRDVLDVKQNKVGTSVISSYDYAVNVIGQRTGVATSGTAFPAVSSWAWSYDALGQVIAADSTVATSDRSYQYDTIGNRQKSADSLTLPIANNYATNALNQYTSRSVGGSPTLNPLYDFDGNMTVGPLPNAISTNGTFAWDAENRLISSTVYTSVPVGSITTTYQYDALSRRMAKAAITAPTIAVIVYFYDTWNCIAEYQRISGGSPVPTFIKTRLWGPDLSGNLQGAGGVGGLLSETSSPLFAPVSHYPTYDGNGNISEYLTATGTTAAHFEYDPFGNTVVNTDTANLFTYRFSTKPRDIETGLYYYGYRYYDPLGGRWSSKDPIGERGGVNLYGFVRNNGLNRIDFLGLRPPDVQLKNCTIAVYGGHGLAIPPENDGVKDPDSLNGSDVPINIQCPPCSAATVIACNANKICNVNNVIPGAPLAVGSPLELDPVEPENSFCPQFARAVEAAKEHAKTICNKTPACCKKVKVQAELLGRAKGMCKSTVGKSGYKGWIYDCDSETLVEGD
jgi:RHS repeat-associated protein